MDLETRAEMEIRAEPETRVEMEIRAEPETKVEVETEAGLTVLIKAVLRPAIIHLLQNIWCWVQDPAL